MITINPFFVRYSVIARAFRSIVVTNITFFLLTSCAPESAWEEEPAVAPPKKVEAPLSVTVVPKGEMNKYRVEVAWSLPEGVQATHILREDAKGGTVQIAIDPNSLDQRVFDDNIDPGSTYAYSIDTSDGNPMRTSIEIPRDVLIDESGPISSQTLKGRLYLKRDITLFTNGESVELVAEEIHSEGVVIKAFPVGTTAARGQNGRSAGSIYIRAKKASGEIIVVADGETGGDGVDGINGLPGTFGTRGNPGTNSTNPAAFNGFLDGFHAMNFERLLEMRPIPDIHGLKFNDKPVYICSAAPTDGGNGENGRDGINGGDGGDGGDSINLLVQISEPSDLKVREESEPGKGGRPGTPGIGGTGGRAGVAGRLDPLGICPPAKDGLPGNRGKDGRVGRQGQPGKKGSSRIEIGKEVKGTMK